MLADELARTHAGAAASLREGMQETLTVTRLGCGWLNRTLASTNPCESMIETVRRVSPNVKYWSSGDRQHHPGVATARRSSNATRTRSSPTGPSSWTMKMTS